MEIREIKSDDILWICRLMKSELGYNISEENMNHRITQMQNENNYCIFVAVEDNQVVGFIGAEIGFAFEISGKVMRIIALAIDKDYQKKGIGKKLIQEAEKYGIKRQVTTIAVNSGLSRTGAHEFYKKQGFFKKGYSFCKPIQGGSL